MPDFQYIARDQNGSSQTGAINAPSQTSAASQLRKKGWVVLKVGPKETESKSGEPSESVLGNLPPRTRQIELTLQQLAMMLRSGMTLIESIQAIAQPYAGRRLGQIWQSIGRELQRGKGLAQAMEQHPQFPAFVVRLVQVGERTGNLEKVLGRAAATMNHRRLSRESFFSAIIYPALVLVLSVFVTAYMIIFLIPRLETYLTSLGREMPTMTQSLIDGSYWLRDHYVVLAMILLILFAIILVTFASKEGRVVFDRSLLRFPLLGRLVRLGETAAFSRGLGMMLKSGITLTDGLMAVEKTLSNRHLRNAVGTAREKLLGGSNLVDAMHQNNTFTPLLSQMIAVGEKSGDMAGVLNEVAMMSDQQFAALVKRLNAIMTPALTLGIGAVVGYVYIAFFMALVAAGS